MIRLAPFLITLLAFVAFAPLTKAQNVGFVQDGAKRINNERQQKGLKPLKYNATLAKAAQFHAEWMARNQTMEHLEEAPTNLEEYRTGNHHPCGCGDSRDVLHHHEVASDLHDLMARHRWAILGAC